MDFTGGPKTETLYVTIQDRHTKYSVTDIILIVALNPAAYSAISQVDVSPSAERSALISQFLLVDDKGTPSVKTDDDVPRGINVNQHIYKNNPQSQCYFYEFHVADCLGTKGSASPLDHVDLTVTLHINEGVISSDGVYAHFECSALIDSDTIVTNAFSHDTNTIVAPPECPVYFYTDPSSGSITFDSVTYSNGDSATFSYGTSGWASANAPAGYVFHHWVVTGHVQVSSTTTNPTEVTIKGGGSLKAVYSIPVGGIGIRINKSELLAPWIGLRLSVLTIVATASVVYLKRRKKNQT